MDTVPAGSPFGMFIVTKVYVKNRRRRRGKDTCSDSIALEMPTPVSQPSSLSLRPSLCATLRDVKYCTGILGLAHHFCHTLPREIYARTCWNHLNFMTILIDIVHNVILVTARAVSVIIPVNLVFSTIEASEVNVSFFTVLEYS